MEEMYLEGLTEFINIEANTANVQYILQQVPRGKSLSVGSLF